MDSTEQVRLKTNKYIDYYCTWFAKFSISKCLVITYYKSKLHFISS